MKKNYKQFFSEKRHLTTNILSHITANHLSFSFQYKQQLSIIFVNIRYFFDIFNHCDLINIQQNNCFFNTIGMGLRKSDKRNKNHQKRLRKNENKRREQKQQEQIRETVTIIVKHEIQNALNTLPQPGSSREPDTNPANSYLHHRIRKVAQEHVDEFFSPDISNEELEARAQITPAASYDFYDQQ